MKLAKIIVPLLFLTLQSCFLLKNKLDTNSYCNVKSEQHQSSNPILFYSVDSNTKSSAVVYETVQSSSLQNIKALRLHSNLKNRILGVKKFKSFEKKIASKIFANYKKYQIGNQNFDNDENNHKKNRLSKIALRISLITSLILIGTLLLSAIFASLFLLFFAIIFLLVFIVSSIICFILSIKGLVQSRHENSNEDTKYSKLSFGLSTSILLLFLLLGLAFDSMFSGEG